MIGAIILNYNTAEDTIKCVRSIEQKTKVAYKIYVVDNFSKDDSAKILIDEFKDDENVVVIISDSNGGYSKGNNIGIKAAIENGYDKILVVNPDVELKNNAIDIMAATLDNDRSIAVVGPEVLDAEGKLQDFVTKGLTYKQFIKSKQPVRFLYNIITGKRFRKTESQRLLPVEESEVKGMVSGCCFMVRSDFFKSIGYFDDNVFLYCEEGIIYEEVKKKGLKVWYNPKACVVHKGSVSIGGWLSVFSRRCLSSSLFYFQLKYAKNMKGIKRALAVFLTKTDFILMSRKLKQDYKQQYRLLKEDIKQHINRSESIWREK